MNNSNRSDKPGWERWLKKRMRIDMNQQQIGGFTFSLEDSSIGDDRREMWDFDIDFRENARLTSG